MQDHRLFRHFFIAAAVLAAASPVCSAAVQFGDAAPITEARDTAPSPLPEKTDFEFVEYVITSSLRYPIDSTLDWKKTLRSRDVNALDALPASSWYTPRLGAESISSETLVKGPELKGAPQFPAVVTGTKKGGDSPGFVIKDARGLKYLIKTDRHEYPALESTVNFVINRLFWAFGYNVPEDYVVKFSDQDLTLGEGITQQNIDDVLIFSAADENGRYRGVASLYLEGTILGPIPARGTRKGDANDLIAHENRRSLRALRMFSALVNNSGMRSDNSLDVYSGEPGQGHTVHYLVDFGEALGAHGVQKNRPWDGFEHFISIKASTLNSMNMGFPLKKWEKLQITPKDVKSFFEAEAFEPATWRETTQFLPMRSSLPDDDYWAAKIIASLTAEHLQALFQTAGHPDPSFSEYMIQTLLKRKEKILRYALSRVSSIEFVSLDNGILKLKDLGPELAGLPAASYKVRFLNAKGKSAAKDSAVTALEIPVTDALASSGGYLNVEITAIREGLKTPQAAQFHIRRSADGKPVLAGILH